MKDEDEFGFDVTDILWGADAIGAIINQTPRQTYWMLQNNLLPARRIGGKYVASKKALIKFLLVTEPLEGGMPARKQA